MNLLPCPFCGGEAEITRYGDRRQSTQYTCTHCGCFLETGEEWDHGRDWNKRYTPVPKIEGIKTMDKWKTLREWHLLPDYVARYMDELEIQQRNESPDQKHEEGFLFVKHTKEEEEK